VRRSDFIKDRIDDTIQSINSFLLLNNKAKLTEQRENEIRTRFSGVKDPFKLMDEEELGYHVLISEDMIELLEKGNKSPNHDVDFSIIKKDMKGTVKYYRDWIEAREGEPPRNCFGIPDVERKEILKLYGIGGTQR
jgi:vacuolar-type H+-ATPase subunit E/Vma4